MAEGLRNPYRLTFDAPTGELVIGDVGADAYEEVNLVNRRARSAVTNFGWPIFEGPLRRIERRLRSAVFPALALAHPDAHAVVTGPVVRSRGLGRLDGRLLLGDYCDGSIRSVPFAALRRRRDPPTRRERIQVPYLSSFGTDARGRVFVASSSDGGVFLISASR